MTLTVQLGLILPHPDNVVENRHTSSFGREYCGLRGSCFSVYAALTVQYLPMIAEAPSTKRMVGADPPLDRWPAGESEANIEQGGCTIRRVYDGLRLDRLAGRCDDGSEEP